MHDGVNRPQLVREHIDLAYGLLGFISPCHLLVVLAFVYSYHFRYTYNNVSRFYLYEIEDL